MNQDKQEQARHLYFAQAKTQKEIAQLLDVSEKTIYNWIRRFSWDQMREAARKAPALISENLCSQIVELQNSIARREPGLRYATAEESLVMQRLITMLDKMKRYAGLSMNMQIIGNFRNWASTRDKSFARDLGLYSGLFLQGYAQNGYYPYELEFGMDKINPIDPYYEEEPKDEPIICHPEPAEGHPEPAEGHPEPAEGPSKEQDISGHLEKQQPEIHPGNSTQLIDDQTTVIPSSPRGTLPPPVKTGKTPETEQAENLEFPWRNRQHELLQQKNTDNPLNDQEFPKRA